MQFVWLKSDIHLSGDSKMPRSKMWKVVKLFEVKMKKEGSEAVAKTRAGIRAIGRAERWRDACKLPDASSHPSAHHLAKRDRISWCLSD